MKFLQIFTKTPSYRKFNYNPRFYDEMEEERKERELRIRKELNAQDEANAIANTESVDQFGHRQRIAGAFRNAKKNMAPPAAPTTTPSAGLLRFLILLILTVGLIAYLTYGQIALYGMALVFIPVYLYWRFKSNPRNG